MDLIRVKEDYFRGLTESELVEKHGIGLAKLRWHCREGWAAERRALRTDTMNKVMERSQIDAIAELALVNGQDIALAKKIRNQLARKMMMVEEADDVPLNDLAMMARVMSDVQRVSRIALDANAEAVRAEIIGRKDIKEYTVDELNLLLEQSGG